MSRLTDRQLAVLAAVERWGGVVSIPEVASEFDQLQPSELLRVCESLRVSSRWWAEDAMVRSPAGETIKGASWVYLGGLRYRLVQRL
jgi:hypothetical protein